MEGSAQVIGSEEVSAAPGSAAKHIREVRAKPAWQFSGADKIRIVVRDFARRFLSPICVGEEGFLLLFIIPGSRTLRRRESPSQGMTVCGIRHPTVSSLLHIISLTQKGRGRRMGSGKGYP